ncbi:MAG: hypothetical protein JXR15_13065 [Shimia sp.]|uniref:hypothetical protein n=1 Tax=Shimia sp. TaxID=1954381 RepID=UPI003B8CA0E8
MSAPAVIERDGFLYMRATMKTGLDPALLDRASVMTGVSDRIFGFTHAAAYFWDVCMMHLLLEDQQIERAKLHARAVRNRTLAGEYEPHGYSALPVDVSIKRDVPLTDEAEKYAERSKCEVSVSLFNSVVRLGALLEVGDIDAARAGAEAVIKSVKALT